MKGQSSAVLPISISIEIVNLSSSIDRFNTHPTSIVAELGPAAGRPLIAENELCHITKLSTQHGKNLSNNLFVFHKIPHMSLGIITPIVSELDPLVLFLSE